MVPQHNLNVVAIMRTEASGLQLDEESTDMNGTKINAHVGDLKDARPGVEIFKNIDVLLLDIDPKDNGDIDRLEEIVTRHFSDVPVLATAADATIQDVRRIMRTGLVDFLPQPISRADLVASLDLAASKRKPKSGAGPSKGKIISFIKGGGGAGATPSPYRPAASWPQGARKPSAISVFSISTCRAARRPFTWTWTTA